jgi:hypothetical protein
MRVLQIPKPDEELDELERLAKENLARLAREYQELAKPFMEMLTFVALHRQHTLILTELPK